MEAQPVIRPPAQQALLPDRPEQGRALLTVLIVMAFLAALALLFSRGADRLSERWSAQLSQSSTVQVLPTSEAVRDEQMQDAREVLRTALPRAELTVLSRAEAGALIQPWLGDTALPPDLAVPGVIRIDSAAALPRDTLERQFAERGLSVAIDDHSRFSGDLKRTVGRLVALGAALVALVGLAATAVSMFATRAGLASQRDIIHVLVQAGATDGFIARLFLGQAARRGIIGGTIGAGLAALLWLFVSIGPGQGSVGWRGIGHGGVGDGLSDLLALLLLCGLFGLICAASAGWAATRQLAVERRRA
ncbi:MAG: FtsX-like permease family protein [Pseudomonadota bacterium]